MKLIVTNVDREAGTVTFRQVESLPMHTRLWAFVRRSIGFFPRMIYRVRFGKNVWHVDVDR